MKLNMKNKILLLAIIFSVILSGCIDKKIIEIDTLNTSNTSADSPAFHEISREESSNLTYSSAPLLQDGENILEFTPEFTLESFTWIYIRDNHNKNPRPLFNWDNVPGNDSVILRDYIRKWSDEFHWVDKAIIIKTDEFKFGWDDVPGNGNESLIELLAQNYGIPWVPDRKIEKSDNGKEIDISIENRNISFALNEDKTRALMKIDNVRTEEFKAKQENGRINIYSDNRTIHIGSGIKITLISNNSAFLSFAQGGGILFPVQEKNGNYIVYDVNSLQNHVISERQYAVYYLSIKNNGSNTSRFILNKLRLISGKGSSIPASMDEILTYPFDEIRLKDVSLLPGQITKGYAAFNVDSMYDAVNGGQKFPSPEKINILIVIYT